MPSSSQLATNLSEDEALLSNSQLSDNMRTAIHFRMAMKKQVNKIIEKIHTQPQTTDSDDNGPTDLPLATVDVKRSD